LPDALSSILEVSSDKNVVFVRQRSKGCEEKRAISAEGKMAANKKLGFM